MQFDFIAPFYDFISRAVFGSTLEKAKTALFGNITNGSTVLFIGGGSGSSLQTLLKQKENLTIDYVDPSQKMILLAKNRVGNSQYVKFYQLPIEKFVGVDYDVIITEFFFDLFDEAKIQELMELIRLKLNNDGKWIDSDFRKPPSRRHKLLMKMMYWFFKITTNLTTDKLVNTKPLFNEAGLKIITKYKLKSGFVTSQLITPS